VVQIYFFSARRALIFNVNLIRESLVSGKSHGVRVDKLKVHHLSFVRYKVYKLHIFIPVFNDLNRRKKIWKLKNFTALLTNYSIWMCTLLKVCEKKTAFTITFLNLKNLIHLCMFMVIMNVKRTFLNTVLNYPLSVLPRTLKMGIIKTFRFIEMTFYQCHNICSISQKVAGTVSMMCYISCIH
jgi:hypothetical protein